MSYNSKLPMDDEYIAAGPADIRENLRALKEDQIVDAGTLAGLQVGNASGNIPEANGIVNKNLNADLLDGYEASDFATASHSHSASTASTAGFMSATDKTKLDGIDNGAQVNQNAFGNVVVGTTTIQADSKTDTLEMVAGTNISITPDATNDRVTIGVSGAIPITNGGTGATIAATALANLGLTATAAELNYMDGVTSKVQTQLGGKAPIAHSSSAITYGISTASVYGHAMASSATPLVAGTATVGIDNGNFAREGHVHPAQTNITGNAVTATTATTATLANTVKNTSGTMTFNWSGQSGQPTWLWGGSTATAMYVYNPSNFDVASVGGYTAAELLASGNNVAILTGTVAHGGTIPLPSGFTESQCHWLLSVDNRQVDDDDTIQCFTSSVARNRTNQGRVATNWTDQRGGRTSNYIIIGVK